MSSRDYTKHLVSSTSPTNTKVGDEYYDPVTNKLYKKLAVNGTTVTNVEVLTNNLSSVTAIGNTTLGTGSANFVGVTGGATGVAPVISAQGTDTNIPLVLQPKNLGAIQAQQTTSTLDGGNVRGAGAVDWQTSRSLATQVASGVASVVGGGRNNQASGAGSVVVGGGTDGSTANFTNHAQGQLSFIGGGILNTAGGVGSVIAGGWQNNADSTMGSILGGRYGTTRLINGYNAQPYCNSPLGDLTGAIQGGCLLLGKQTTDATPTALTSDGAAAGTTNQVIMPNNSAYTFEATVISGVTGGGNTKSWKLEGAIKRGASAAATSIVGTVTTTVLAQDAGASAWTMVATADTTNGGIRFTFTGQAGTTIRTVCRVDTTEMTF